MYVKKILCAFLAACILGLTGCAARPAEGEPIDFRPAHHLAEECFAAKMQAEGVGEYKIEERSISVRTGSTIFEVKLIYTADGGEERNYLYRIQCENGAAEVLEEGEELGFLYQEK